jgi:CheY-like chemotaxis protein
MAQTRTPKVLVVDDEDDILTFICTLLEDNGFATLKARTGVEAMTLVRSEHPDLVTLDITMPEQSGVKTYREIKDDPALKGTPVIIVTGVADDFQQFISSRKQVPPPDGYLSKPIDKEGLLAQARKLTGGRAPRSPLPPILPRRVAPACAARPQAVYINDH